MQFLLLLLLLLLVCPASCAYPPRGEEYRVSPWHPPSTHTLFANITSF